MSGALVDLSRGGDAGAATVDVAIVGSGAAGATAARELARAGRDVLVLEEGADLTGPALTGRDGRMYDQLYMDRGGRSTEDLGVTVLQGRALGGGTVINACDVIPPSDGALRLWARRFGLGDLAPEALGPHTDAALADLSANLPDDAQVNRNNQLLHAGASALGWRGERMRHNRVGCAGFGTCLIGCPLGAKRNARTVAIPAALEAGARVLTRARVVRIDDATAELKRLTVRVLDPDGYHERGELTVRARHVVLAANAIGSTALLRRSGLGNDHVGRHVLLQPQLPVAARFDEAVRFFRGIPQVFAVTQFEEPEHDAHGWWGYRIEAIAGTPGIVATLLGRLGHEGKTLMAGYAHLAAALCLTPDAPRGEVHVERSGRLRIRYTLDDEQRTRLRAAARAAARCYLAAGAREVFVPGVPPLVLRGESELDAIDGLSLRPASVPLLSAHQQGGVRMSANAADGAATPDGEVRGTRGVFVFDSSGFPSSASSHTMTPIMAVARSLTHRLLTRLPAAR